jgi:sugar phosphate isomerase/epimerase
LLPQIRVVHAKDACEDGFTVLGRGKIDWEGQLKALLQDGFQGGVTIEPRTVPDGGTIAQASAKILAYLRERIHPK